MDNYGMKVQATVDLPSAKKVDDQIRALEKSISKLKISGQFDDTALRNLTNQLNNLKATVSTASFSPTALNELSSQVQRALSNINISGVNISNSGNGAGQVGQQIGQSIVNSAQNTIDRNNINTEKLKADAKNLINNLNNFSLKNDGFDTFKTDINGVEVSLDSLISKLTSVNNTADLSTIRSQANALKSAFSELSKVNKIQFDVDNGSYESKVNSLIEKTKQWTNIEGEARISTNNLSNALNELALASSAYADNPTEATQRKLVESSKALDAEYKKITNSVRKMNAEIAKDSAVSSLHNKVSDFMSKNGKTVKYYGDQLNDIYNKTSQGSKITIKDLELLKQKLLDIQTTARNSGKLGKTFFQTIREGMSTFSYWTSSTFIVMKAFQSIKSGINTVKELDTTLVDFKKTTTMTANELENFYYSSNNVAKQMGVSTKEIINQASAWSRLGFSSGEAATKMAKFSSQFASISPGMDVDEATTSLVSMMRAYDVEVYDVLDGIMSRINEVGNKFGTSNAEIAEGLRKSSAAMSAVGGSIESNIALFTGAQEIVQDASQVGNAIRSIALRVRSYDEETEEFSEDLANIKGEVIDLTKVASNNGQGVSLFTDSSQTEYRDLVDYLGDISDIWDEIDAKSQNELLNKLFGKNRAQVGAAMIKNFDQIRAAIEVMENSAGSADKEMSVIMDSLDYKLNRLSETGTSVAQNLFKRDDMKTVVDGLTSVMNVIDSITSKIGLFGSIGLGAGLFAGFKNVGGWKNVSPICYLF